MKKIHFAFLILFSLIIACDTIEGEYIEESAPFITDVILFEFTGIHCPQCPGAQEVIKDLSSQFGDRFHSVSIHAGSFSQPRTETDPDFRTLVGYAIDNSINIKSYYPTGTVMDFNPDANGLSGVWSTELAKLGWARPDVDIDYSMQIKDSILKANFTIAINDDIQGDFYFCAYVTEDKIIAFQQDGGFKNDEYEHNHVLRTSFNGAWGTKIKSGIIVETELSLKLEPNWKANDLHIVPFVYNNQNLKVLPSYITKIE